MSPLSNAYLTAAQCSQMERFYPLHCYVCHECLLVQLEQVESPQDIFGNEYAYFSSYSDSWLQHCQRYVAEVVERFRLNSTSQIVELGSNDGYLLQYFRDAGIPALGIEPAQNIAAIAEAKGIPTLNRFFSTNLARELAASGLQADLLIGNNVLAHVPDLNDFVAGIQCLLHPNGVFTLEFPHILQLLQHQQFDTIYHEHFSYFSFYTVDRIFTHHGLKLFDVEELPTHGGSLRIYGGHAASQRAIAPRLHSLQQKEHTLQFDRLTPYLEFAPRVVSTKYQLLQVLIAAKQQQQQIVGYGAPAKGNTLLNYCGIRTDFLDYTVDRNPHKQGKFLPGTHIPIYAPEHILSTRPDYVLLLPWNLQDEIMAQMAVIRDWGGQFIIPIPYPQVR